MQLFKFHSGGILSHSWKGSHGPTCGVLHRSAVAFSITSASTRAPKSEIRDPQQQKGIPNWGSSPNLDRRPPGYKSSKVLNFGSCSSLGRSFASAGATQRHTPCLPQQKVEKLWPTPGTFNPVALGDNMQFFSAEFSLSQVMLLMNRNFRSSQIWHLKQMQSCQVRFRLLYQLQCILRVCQLGGSSPPPLLCGRCLLF